MEDESSPPTSPPHLRPMRRPAPSRGELNTSNSNIHTHASITTLTRSLDLSGYQLRVVPRSLVSYTAVSYLALSHNQLTNIPESLMLLPQLRSLKLDHNLISSLPPQLLAWESLWDLNLSHNLLTVIPPSITHLKKLQRLDLSHNALCSLSDEIGLLRNLERLELGHNKISSLPDSLAGIPRLTHVGAEQNQLEHFPVKGTWHDIESLQLKGNPLAEFVPMGLICFAEERQIQCDLFRKKSKKSQRTLSSSFPSPSNNGLSSLSPSRASMRRGTSDLSSLGPSPERAPDSPVLAAPSPPAKLKRSRSSFSDISFNSVIQDLTESKNKLKNSVIRRVSPRSRDSSCDEGSGTPKFQSEHLVLSPQPSAIPRRGVFAQARSSSSGLIRRKHATHRSEASSMDVSTTDLVSTTEPSPSLKRGRRRKRSKSSSASVSPSPVRGYSVTGSILDTNGEQPFATINDSPEPRKGRHRRGLLGSWGWRDDKKQQLESVKSRLANDDAIVWGTEKSETIRSAPLSQMQQLLIYDSRLRDLKQFQREFVLVYPSLVDDEELLRFLMKRYNKGCDQVKRRVLDVIEMMVTYHQPRFTNAHPNGEHLRDVFIEFAGKHCTDKIFGSELLSTLAVINTQPPQQCVIENYRPRLCDLSPKQLAKQLALIDYRLFSDIPLHDLLDGRFLKTATNAKIRELSNWFNKESHYVATSILLTPTVAERTALINRFINTAHRCWELHDYSSSLAFFSGLHIASIRRLKASWHGVSVRALMLYQEMEDFFAVDGNFRPYRDEVRSISGRCIPLLSIVERDLIYIEEGNEKYAQEGVINFQRCVLLANQLKTIHQHKLAPYPYAKMEGIMEQFDVQERDEDELWNLSNLLEPHEHVRDIPAPAFSKRKALREFGTNLKSMISEDVKDAYHDLRDGRIDGVPFSPRLRHPVEKPVRKFARSKSVSHTSSTDFLDAIQQLAKARRTAKSRPNLREFDDDLGLTKDETPLRDSDMALYRRERTSPRLLRAEMSEPPLITPQRDLEEEPLSPLREDPSPPAHSPTFSLPDSHVETRKKKKEEAHSLALTAKGRKAFEGVTIRPGAKDKGLRMAGDIRSLPQRETYRLLAPPVVQRNSMTNLTDTVCLDDLSDSTESTWREQTDSARADEIVSALLQYAKEHDKDPLSHS